MFYSLWYNTFLIINYVKGSEEPEQRLLTRNDSDIEIISNPSEKSVEILEVISRFVIHCF